MSHPIPPPVRWLALPRAGIGYLSVGSTLYQVREVEAIRPDGSGYRVWQLETQAGLAFILEPHPEAGLSCSACGAGCWHAAALAAALELLERRRLAEVARVATL